MSTFTPGDLRVALEHGLDQVVPPPPDLAGVHRRRRRTQAWRATTGLLVAASLVTAAFVLARHTPEVLDRSGRYGFADQGPLDLGQGARAWAVDGKVLHVGGNTYPWPSSIGLDTRAVATQQGLVFPDGRGRPQLLGADGRVTALDESPADAVPSLRSPIRVDPATSRIAYATSHDGEVTVKVLDLASGDVVASTPLPCVGACKDVSVDAFDSDRVFVSTADGTTMWRVGEPSDTLVSFAAKGTTVVDARNKVLLFQGREAPRPLDGWTYVKGHTDERLTFDGGHVVGWSSRLRSTDGGAPVRLDQGAVTRKGPLSFWSLDSDGSVLVATVARTYPTFDFYDCAVPSGSCTYLGREASGDPVFIGNDS
jgi:hypothetical protein